jgi:hypothetical protein
MKAANLLIYRDLRVKLGDLGISVKISPKDIGGNLDKYKVKGMTKGYVTEKVEESFNDGNLCSKNELYMCDQ